MTDEPDKVHRPEHDHRVHDPLRFLRDRLREADAMIALWERSLKISAKEDLQYWRRERADILRRLTQSEIEDQPEQHDAGESTD